MNLTVKIAYDIYCRKADPSLRIAVAPGARLPAQFKARDWKLMAKDTSLLHSDASRDIGLKGYCYFNVGSSPVDFKPKLVSTMKSALQAASAHIGNSSGKPVTPATKARMASRIVKSAADGLIDASTLKLAAIKEGLFLAD